MKKLEFHHPTSLSHENPDVPPGTTDTITTSMIRLNVQRPGEIRVIFKQNVQESNWTCKLSSTRSWELNVGGEAGLELELTVSARNWELAKATICAKLRTGYGMSTTEAEECVVSIVSRVNDRNEYSELKGNLYRQVRYLSPVRILLTILMRSPRFRIRTWIFNPQWARNDLDLKFEQRWSGSANVFDISFSRNPEPEGAIRGLQNVVINRRQV